MRVLLGRGAKSRHTGQVTRGVVASASNEGYPKVLNHREGLLLVESGY